MSHELLIQLATVWLTVSLKCIPLYLVMLLLSNWPARRRPAWRSYTWLLFLFSFPCLSVLEWTGIHAPARSVLTSIPSGFLFAAGHAYFAVSLVLVGLMIHSAIRLRILRGYSNPLDICVEEDETDQPAPPFLLHGTTLYRNGQLSTPTSFGILRPAIVLPDPPVGTIYRHFVRAALVHELIKVLRFDALWTLLARLVQCVFFAHPLVWLAFRRYCLAREQVCDRWTVRTTADVSEYETHLLAITRVPARTAAMSLDTPMNFTGQEGVRARITDLQNCEQPESLQPWPSVAATVIWMLLIAVIAAVGVMPAGNGWRATVHVWPMLMGATGALVAGVGLSILILVSRRRRSRMAPPVDGLAGRSRLTIADCVQRIEREWQQLHAIMSITARQFEPVFLMLIVIAATISFWLIAGQSGGHDLRTLSVQERLLDDLRRP